MQYQTSILAAIVALVFIIVAAFVALGVSGRLDNTSTPVLVSIIGMVSTLVITLVAIVRVDRVAEKVNEVETKAEAIERRVIENGANSPHP
jgi:uncharacterized membrane protein (DUF485 family)